MKFAYRAYEKSGKPANGSIEAATLIEAKDQLKRQGLIVTQVGTAEAVAASSKPGTPGAPRSVRRGRFLGAGSRLKNLTLFMRQLAVLVATGTTVVEAIGVLERQIPEGAWRNAVIDVRTRVEEGEQLSDALAAHPEYFDDVCRSLIAAGESRGQLAEMLQRLSDLSRQQMKVRNALAGAMVYPCMLLVIAFSVLGVMIGFVMPRFEGLFGTLGAALPPMTKFLMEISHLLQSYWWSLPIIIPIVLFAAYRWFVSDHGKRTIDYAMVRTPQIGRITRAFATAQLARILGVLLEGKVTLLDALHLTRRSTRNGLYVALIARAEEAVTKGEPVSTAFADPSLISPSVYEAIRSGERTGQIGSVLIHMADFLDEDNEVVVKSLTSIIEPVILVILGLVIGGVAMSMFLPLFDLTAAGGGAGGAP